MKIEEKDNFRSAPSRMLTPCPLCGSQPHCCETQGDVKKYKLFCSESGLHVSCGDWFSTHEQAEEDWEKRTRDKYQPSMYKHSNLDVIKESFRNMDAELFAETLLNNDWQELFNIPELLTTAELAEWLKSEVAV